MKQRRNRKVRTAKHDDRALVELAKAGDHRAFTELVKRHDDKMRGLAYRLTGSQSAMDDALQDAYLKAFRSLANYRSDAAFSTWLYTVVRSVCMDRHRYNARRPQVSLEVVGEPNWSTADHSEQIAARQELQEALAELPEDQMAVVILVDGEGLSYDEVAETLSINPGTVASRLSRARTALRQKLDYDPEGGQR